jgi:hypothetical protein
VKTAVAEASSLTADPKQHIPNAFRLVRRGTTIIDKGRIVYTSTIADLKANDNIRQRYLEL